MAEYYRNEFSSVHRNESRNRRHPVMRGVDLLMQIATLLTVVMLFLTLYAPTHAPSGWFFPVVGLLAPVTYLVAFLLLLYWIIRWRWIWVLLAALPVGIGLFYLGLYLKIDFRSGLAELPSRRGTITLINYNVRQFYGPDEESSRDSLLQWIRRKNPDLVCLQEFDPTTGSGSRELVDSIMGEEYVSTTGDTISSNVIYSRYPILRSGHTCRALPSMRSIWADILIKGDTVRLFNNHLQRTSITREDDEFLSRDQFLQDTARQKKLHSIVQRLGENSLLRAVEVDSIAAAVARSPYRTILCGDFNDIPFSYTYRMLSTSLQDAFREAGRGYSSTFLGFNDLLRIDFILMDPSFEILEYREDSLRLSDHKPLWTRFALNSLQK